MIDSGGHPESTISLSRSAHGALLKKDARFSSGENCGREAGTSLALALGDARACT